MPDLLEIEGLSIGITAGGETAVAVDGVDLRLKPSRTLALLGESGCGKSLTALAILGLLPPGVSRLSGSIRLEGECLTALPEARLRRLRGARMGMIFQEPMTSLNPVLSVGMQIAEPLAVHRGLKGAALRERVHGLLAAVGIPDPARVAKSYPHQLSGGMKQRVMIAMAIACEPRLLIADEPTTALDVTIQAQVLSLLAELKVRRDMGMLFITHDLAVVAQVADEVAVMYAGRVVEHAPLARFLPMPLHPYARRLIAALPGRGQRGGRLAVIPGTPPAPAGGQSGCAFAPRCDHAFARCFAEAPAWHERDGHGVRCHLYADAAREAVRVETDFAATEPAPVAASVPSLLAVHDLVVHFPIRKGVFQRTVGWVRAVDGVSFSLAQGRTLALVGESGCGKTTVGRAVLGLLRPSAGEVRFDGRRLDLLSGAALRRARREFQIVFQDPYASLDPRMTVGRIIEEGMAALGVERPEARAAAIAGLLAAVGLPEDAAGRYPHEFSGGQRQRVAIARALAVRPRLLVLDEPTSALDVSVQAQILDLLADLQRERGLAYLFITHNLAVVEFLAQDVAVMYLGRIVECGTVDAVLGRPRHPYTQALLAAVPCLDEPGRRPVTLRGELPSPARPPAGCHFHPRCPSAMAVCREAYPAPWEVDGRRVACHLY